MRQLTTGAAPGRLAQDQRPAIWWNKWWKLRAAVGDAIIQARIEGAEAMREAAARICEDSVKWYPNGNVNECTKTPPELARDIRNLDAGKIIEGDGRT